jgi:hypothetical protein
MRTWSAILARHVRNAPIGNIDSYRTSVARFKIAVSSSSFRAAQAVLSRDFNIGFASWLDQNALPSARDYVTDGVTVSSDVDDDV